jgi:hypothetical protein
MNIKSLVIFVGFVLTSQVIRAQNFDGDSIYYTPIPKNETDKKVSSESIDDKLFIYFFNLQVGPLIGCNNCGERKEITFTASTIHGITIGKKLRTGLGIGLDSYYSWQTMPLFASASWDLFGTKNTNALFIQFNYGWAKPWLNESAQTSYGYKSVSGGRMINTQLGYRIKYHDLKISFGIGYKFQRASVHFEYPNYYYWFDGSPIQGRSSTMKIQEDMNRLMFSMAIGWK